MGPVTAWQKRSRLSRTVSSSPASATSTSTPARTSSGTQTYKEDFRSASAAAVHGGVTQVVDMPNNPVAPVDDARYAAKEKPSPPPATYTSPFTPASGLSPSHSQRHVPVQGLHGPPAWATSSSPRRPQLETVIAGYRGRNVSFHCEDPEILEASRGEPTHEQRRPPPAPRSPPPAFALHLIETYGLQGKLCHYSTREGLRADHRRPRNAASASPARSPRTTFSSTPPC